MRGDVIDYPQPPVCAALKGRHDWSPQVEASILCGQARTAAFRELWHDEPGTAPSRLRSARRSFRALGNPLGETGHPGVGASGEAWLRQGAVAAFSRM